MSAGTANPTTWPRCLFPAAYGQAGATKIFCLCLSSAKDVLRSGEDHDTSRLCLGRAAEREERLGQQVHAGVPGRLDRLHGGPGRFGLHGWGLALAHDPGQKWGPPLGSRLLELDADQPDELTRSPGLTKCFLAHFAHNSNALPAYSYDHRGRELLQDADRGGDVA